MRMPSCCCSVSPFWGKEGLKWSKPESRSPLSPGSPFLTIGKGRLSGKIARNEDELWIPNLDSNPMDVTTNGEDSCLPVNLICQMPCIYLSYDFSFKQLTLFWFDKKEKLAASNQITKRFSVWKQQGLGALPSISMVHLAALYWLPSQNGLFHTALLWPVPQFSYIET